MRQLTYIRKNTLEWWDRPDPILQEPGDAIVRPVAAARCDGDKVFLFRDLTRRVRVAAAVHYLDPIITQIFGSRPFQGPFAVGHECVAEVVETGPAVTGFSRGDLAIVPWAISCGTCLHCRSHLTSKCLSAGDTLLSGYGLGPGLGPWGGVVSDLVRVPYAMHMLVPVPAGLDPAAIASASDNIPDGWRAVAPQLAAKPGAPVLVVGGGAESIGLYAAGIAVALGAESVDYVDGDPQRLGIAAELGANPISIPPTSMGRWFRRNAPVRSGLYPITVDASADPDGLRFAIRSLAPGGTCTSVAYYFQKGTAIPLLQMYANDSTLHTGVSHPRAALPQVLELIASGRFQPEKINTLVAPWDQADKAYLERTTKVVVTRPAIHSPPRKFEG